MLEYKLRRQGQKILTQSSPYEGNDVEQVSFEKNGESMSTVGDGTGR